MTVLMRISFTTLMAGLCVVGMALSAMAQELDGPAIGRLVDARDEGTTLRQTMTMRLIGRNGAERTRETVVLRRQDPDADRTAIYFLEPTNVKGTAFLTYDYQDESQADDRWLYLPAIRRVRRISAADRGDYFLGTDFTYQDIQNSTKFPLDDYDFVLTGTEDVLGVTAYKVDITPKSDQIAKELGYSRVVALINPHNWMPFKADYWDTNHNFMKTIKLEDQHQVGEIWTVGKITATNHKTGHSTQLIYSNIQYNTDIPDRQLTQRGLQRGL